MSHSQKSLRDSAWRYKEQELQKVLFCIRKGSTYCSASDTLLNYLLLLLQAATKLANLTPSEISVIICVFFTWKVIFQGWIPFFAVLTKSASGWPVVFVFLDHLSKGLWMIDYLEVAKLVECRFGSELLVDILYL